jgi:hypothetical protein
MKNRDKDLELVLTKVLHEFAYELDANYENDQIAIMAQEDDTFRSFRRAFKLLSSRGVKLSKRVRHVQRRIEDAWGDEFKTQLPDIDSDV